MKRTFVALILLLVLMVPGYCLCWMGKVTGIVRADEINVMKEGGQTEKVRLYGIDCPAAPQDFGNVAHLYTSRRVMGRMVEVTPLFQDHFDRVVAWVFVDGENLNKELLRTGMAWWYKKYLPFEKELERLEQEARKARVGLWSGNSPVPPWEYQPLPGGGPENLSEKANPSRRGQVREKIISETGASKRVIGDAGSVREKLMRGGEAEGKK